MPRKVPERSDEPRLVAYWFEFEFEEGSPGDYLGPTSCGVTAFDVDDARRPISDMFFPEDVPAVWKLVDDLDVSLMPHSDQARATRRGIWYPTQLPRSPEINA